MNELLKSDDNVSAWLASLTRISARLYEYDNVAWSVFEPARKQIADSVAWLAFEGDLDLATANVTTAIAVLERHLPNCAQQWRTVAVAVEAAIGRFMLRELLAAGHG